MLKYKGTTRSNPTSIKVEQRQNKVKYIQEYIFFKADWQYAFNQ